MNLFRPATAILALLVLSTSAWAVPLRFGVLNDVDSLPYLVAADEGLFAAAGVDVTLVPFQSPVERDAAFQAGAVDGIIGDVLGAALAVNNGFEVRIVAATDGRYLLLGTPGTSATKASDLAGVQIGGSSNTVIHYMIDRFLTDAGVKAADVKLMAVPRMPLRLEMLLTGTLPAASLPEPLATVAIGRGARLIATSDAMGADPGAVIFTKAALDTRTGEIAAFLRAGQTASARINAAPDSYRPFLARKMNFPEEAVGTFRFVTYLPLRLPAEAAVTAIVDWMRAKGLVKAELQAAALIDRRAVPAQ